MRLVLFRSGGRPGQALCALLLCAACRKPAPGSPPASAPAGAAENFCAQDLSGVWLNASDRHFAYRFRDHGGVIRGEFLERADDGGLKSPGDPILFEFVRTAEAPLKGTMRSTQVTRGGRACPVEFGIEITSCRADALQATVEMDAPVTEECRRQAADDGGELPTHRTEFVFVKDALHPSGGGEAPDAH